MEAEEAQDAQIILADALVGVTYEADASSLQIVQTAYGIMQGAIGRNRQRIHGEIAPPRVLFEVAAETHDRAAAVRRDIFALRRNLEGTPADNDRNVRALDSGEVRFEMVPKRSRDP